MKRGFTLLELTLALALTSALVAVTAMTLDLHVQQVERTSRVQQTSAVTQLIAASLERDAAAIWTESAAVRARSVNARHRAVTRSSWFGTTSSLAIVRVAETRSLSKNSTILGVVYQLVDRPGQHQLTWFNENRTLTFHVTEAGMVRLETELDPLTWRPHGPVRVDWVAGDLRDVQWKYFANASWQDDWSTPSYLPQAVQLSWSTTATDRPAAPVRIVVAIPSGRGGGDR